jgi:hypothetical protein
MLDNSKRLWYISIRRNKKNKKRKGDKKMSYFMGNGRADTVGAGSYRGKAAVIEILAEKNGFVLQKAPNSATGRVVFKILWDGECISLLSDEKEARTMFADFTYEEKKRGRKVKAKAAA